LHGTSLGVAIVAGTHSHPKGIGVHQSPVAIDSDAAIPAPVPALDTIGFHDLLPRPISITHTGHSVELKYWKGGLGPKITGAYLNGEYEVEAFHFHWGSKNDQGSEHVIDGTRFPLEMHIVTRKSTYPTLQEALDHKDGIAVVAVFFSLRPKDNPALTSLVSELKYVKVEGSTKRTYHPIQLASLFPRSTDVFFTYRGSLTTPPYSEAVTWILFPDPLPVSNAQLRCFRTLSGGDESPLADNYRRVQDLNKRKIYVRLRASEPQPKVNLLHGPLEPEFWVHKAKKSNTIEAESEHVESL